MARSVAPLTTTQRYKPLTRDCVLLTRRQADAKKVLKAVSSWMRVKSEKASLEEIKVRYHRVPLFQSFDFTSGHPLRYFITFRSPILGFCFALLAAFRFAFCSKF